MKFYGHVYTTDYSVVCHLPEDIFGHAYIFRLLGLIICMICLQNLTVDDNQCPFLRLKYN